MRTSRNVQYAYVHEWTWDPPPARRARPPAFVESHKGFTLDEMVRDILQTPVRAFDRTFSSTRVEVSR